MTNKNDKNKNKNNKNKNKNEKNKNNHDNDDDHYDDDEDNDHDDDDNNNSLLQKLPRLQVSRPKDATALVLSADAQKADAASRKFAEPHSRGVVTSQCCCPPRIIGSQQ
ncbi:unnamed protein product [Polarella glacialis]|uniref:Uncharacterized protein n=1 Tax=Polarella glacialis TaxID=89957 RepID=A0A813FGR7_POLGL|nr:unnamed protein product [Polarella glacialis]